MDVDLVIEDPFDGDANVAQGMYRLSQLRDVFAQVCLPSPAQPSPHPDSPTDYNSREEFDSSLPDAHVLHL